MVERIGQPKDQVSLDDFLNEGALDPKIQEQEEIIKKVYGAGLWQPIKTIVKEAWEKYKSGNEERYVILGAIRMIYTMINGLSSKITNSQKKHGEEEVNILLQNIELEALAMGLTNNERAMFRHEISLKLRESKEFKEYLEKLANLS